MTENEAVKWLKAMSATQSEIIHKNSLSERKEALHIAIVAIEEIQKYQAIGTVEECREARERQRAKKPIANNDERKIYMCQCGSTRICTMDNFCPICGQAISWEHDTD